MKFTDITSKTLQNKSDLREALTTALGHLIRRTSLRIKQKLPKSKRFGRMPRFHPETGRISFRVTHYHMIDLHYGGVFDPFTLGRRALAMGEIGNRALHAYYIEYGAFVPRRKARGKAMRIMLKDGTVLLRKSARGFSIPARYIYTKEWERMLGDLTLYVNEDYLSKVVSGEIKKVRWTYPYLHIPSSTYERVVTGREK
ncbi:MAG: hypothetical protein ACTSYR_02185 [Candidatus Odinarchaeia archaeon]